MVRVDGPIQTSAGLVARSGLKRVVDLDSNGLITGAEFLAYVRADERVNQKWLTRALDERPCVVANAILHYQTVMGFCELAESLRAECTDNDNKTSECVMANWVAIQQWYGNGPPYVEEHDDGSGSAEPANHAQCLEINAGKSELAHISKIRGPKRAWEEADNSTRAFLRPPVVI